MRVLARASPAAVVDVSTVAASTIIDRGPAYDVFGPVVQLVSSSHVAAPSGGVPRLVWCNPARGQAARQPDLKRVCDRADGGHNHRALGKARKGPAMAPQQRGGDKKGGNAKKGSAKKKPAKKDKSKKGVANKINTGQ
jgi:hypothetical protein